MANLKKRDLTRVNMNLPTMVVERVKYYADELGVNVTAAYTILLNSALDQNDNLVDNSKYRS